MYESPHHRDDGTVLLSTLLVLSLISAVALALLATLRKSVERARTLDAAAQADLYLSGARDFARAQMDALGQSGGSGLSADLLPSEPVVLPFENGAIALQLADGTHCLRLSALADANGQGSDTEQQNFEGLMVQLGLDSFTAQRIAAAAVDWVDADSQLRPNGAEDGTYLSRTDVQNGPHRTANTAMESVAELRALDGMTEDIFRVVHPHVCLGETGAPTRFNIDSAEARHLPVLAALLGGDANGARVAEALLRDRPSGGYGDMATLLAAPALDGFDNPAAELEARILFRPARVTAEVTVRYGPAERRQLLAFEGVDSARPRLSYIGWGVDEFPSFAWARSGPGADQGDVER